MPASATAKAPAQDYFFSEEVLLLLQARLAVEGKSLPASVRATGVVAPYFAKSSTRLRTGTPFAETHIVCLKSYVAQR